MSVRALTASVLIVLATSGPVTAENWPRWRGPLGTGVSPERNLPLRWGPEDVAWEASLAGTGVSSPVVWGERIFVTSQRGRVGLKPGRHPRLARDEDAPAEKKGPFEINWGHGSSPALHGDLLFLPCYHEPASYLLAVDTRTGKTRWKVDRGRNVRSYSTPVVIPGPSGDEVTGTPAPSVA